MKSLKRTALSASDVAHIAKLANIPVSGGEMRKITKQLQDILLHVNQLNEVNTDNIKPTYQTLDGTTNIWRDDVIKQSLPQDLALSQAKRTHNGYFVTKGVFQDEA